MSSKEFKDMASKNGVVCSRFYCFALKNEVLVHKTEGHPNYRRRTERKSFDGNSRGRNREILRVVIMRHVN